MLKYALSQGKSGFEKPSKRIRFSLTKRGAGLPVPPPGSVTVKTPASYI